MNKPASLTILGIYNYHVECKLVNVGTVVPTIKTITPSVNAVGSIFGLEI